MKPGDILTLNTPTNTRLHGKPGTVGQLTDYGCVVKTAAAGSGEFRALPDEVVLTPVATVPTPKPAAKDLGYVGDSCTRCGSIMVRRNGSCKRQRGNYAGRLMPDPVVV